MTFLTRRNRTNEGPEMTAIQYWPKEGVGLIILLSSFRGIDGEDYLFDVNI
ncbi:MAG TPA: hypothetical protein VKA98_05055 [Nitrososphaeraceae archaeon]|nr:hypothetical protein [Nitrososphaeraceae archaeon]